MKRKVIISLVHSFYLLVCILTMFSGLFLAMDKDLNPNPWALLFISTISGLMSILLLTVFKPKS